ncbi:MAG TPA: hypothetical protein VMM60_02910 [Ilumatobacter sp.]|nr:hypothetical protein [Ilumatobacter sp.]
MQLRDGMCGDTQVLSTEALSLMHSDRLADLYGSASNESYGMGWWVEDGRITDTGAYGSVPWLDLENGHGAYLVIEENAITGVQLASQLYEPVAAAIAAADT